MSSSSSFPPPGAKKSEDTSNQKNRKGKRKKLDWTAQGSPSSNANSFTPRPNPVTPRLELPGKFRQHQNANSRAHPSRYINTRAENSSDSLVKAMERISIARASIKKQNVPLTEFTIFQRMPAELRLKVWKTFCLMVAPRLLEVEVDQASTAASEISAPRHSRIRTAPKSSKPPVAFHICRESSMEALKIWQPYSLSSAAAHAPPIFFNPRADIIYFGEGNCMATIVHFLDYQYYLGKDLPRLAILCSGQLFNCCDYNLDDPFQGVDPMDIDYGYAMAGGCTPMQALHGIDRLISLSGLSTGCRGLREVNWIVPSKLMAFKAGEMRAGIGLRPAVGNGLTTGQEKWKIIIEEDIERVNSGEGLRGVGDNKWVGDDKPEFKWMSFAPIPGPGKQYDAMKLCGKGESKLKYRLGDITAKIKDLTGCEITVMWKEYRMQKEIELGLYGTETGINSAKEQIVAMLCESSFKYKYKQGYGR